MTFYANQLTKLIVQDRDGIVKGELTGKVKFEAGDGFDIDVDGDDMTFNAGSAYNDPNSKYQTKFRVILDGGTWVDPDTGIPYSFSGMPYYVASIAGVKGNLVNNFDFLSNACGQVGILIEDGGLGPGDFVDPYDASAGESAEPPPSLRPGDKIAPMLNGNGELELLDICQACIDCEDYAQIVTLMRRIEEFQNWDVKRNLNDASEGGQLALFHQYQSTIHYWNYLVHNQCIPLKTIKGNEHQDHIGEIWKFFAINTGYFLKDCVDLSDITQKLTISVSWCDPAEPGDLRILFTQITRKPESLPPPGIEVTRLSSTTWEVLITYPPMSYNDAIMFQLLVRSLDGAMCSATVTSEWCNTHITIPIGQSEDPPGDQCVTRGPITAI